jgi:hypothetical protein
MVCILSELGPIHVRGGAYCTPHAARLTQLCVPMYSIYNVSYIYTALHTSTQSARVRAARLPNLLCSAVQDLGVKHFCMGPDVTGMYEYFCKEGGNVSKTPMWPSSGADFSPPSLYSHRDAWASLHLLGQPNAFLARR